MRPIRFAAFATWMVEHLTFGLHNEALSGDLLEEMQRGRSTAWYWHQVCLAIAAGAISRLRDVALPLMFCAAWASLYPTWSFLSQALLARAMPAGWTVPGWPWSALVPLGYGMVPALTFVWFGFLIYVLLRPRIFQVITARHLLWGLSASLNVLLLSTHLLLWHFRQSRIDLRSLMRENFYSAFHLASVSIPLALSLFAALCFTLARTPRIMRAQRTRRLQPVRRVPHIARIFSFAVVPFGTRSTTARTEKPMLSLSVD